MRLGMITREEILSRDDDGKKYPKKDRGYAVFAIVNGQKIFSYDDSWYGAYQGCLEAAKWAAKEEPAGKVFRRK